MRKKCVQHVEGCGITLGITTGFTQALKTLVAAVCTNSVHPLAFRQPFHSHKLAGLIGTDGWLSTLSTRPMVTTIYVYNKQQARVAKEYV